MSKRLIDEATVTLALEALEAYKGFIDDAHILEGQWHWIDGADQAQVALKALAEQPAQQEPESECNPQDLCAGCRCKYAAQPAEQPAQQELVEWMELLREARDNCKASIVEEGISAGRKEYRIDLEARLTAALNTSPQPAQRTWVGLTDEEIEQLITDAGFTRSDLLMMGACIDQIARLVEAKLRSKNEDRN